MAAQLAPARARPWRWWHIGDLSESFVKREAGAQDSGRLFGARGGALDRVDGILFAAVAR
jgi:CDP-diglyceride synthetase